MKRLLGQALAVTAVGVFATALTPACADDDQSIFVLMALAPPQSRTNGACTYQADPTQPKMSAGVLDVGARYSYQVELLVGNQLIARGDTAAGRAESNRVRINGAVVHLTDANGGTIAEYSVLGSGFADVQQNNVPGFGVVGLSAIDVQRGKDFDAKLAVNQNTQVVANIKLFGKTLGGVDLESGEFQFPITVCKNCLILSSGDDPTTSDVDCKLGLDTSSGVVLPCIAGQDEYTPCQMCVHRDLCDRPQPRAPLQ